MSRLAYETGLSGEDAAQSYLQSKGFTSVARRYRGADGEIDLIMEDGDVVVFVEVKAAVRGQRGDGMVRVTADKQRRMTHAAMTFLASREWMSRPARFDVVEITQSGLLHVPNAFAASAW